VYDVPPPMLAYIPNMDPMGINEGFNGEHHTL
jgi:hypothetical protein